MSTAMKPDYYIAHNGLPNILLVRSRHVLTKATMKNDRVSGNQKQIHPPAKNKRFSGVNQQAPVQPQRDSEKNAKNKAIKESLRDSKAQKDLINAQIASSGTWRQPAHTLSATNCANTDNDCNRSSKRITRTLNSTNLRDNRLTHQRKYDNTIFRHDLPDRLVLPPLPI